MEYLRWFSGGPSSGPSSVTLDHDMWADVQDEAVAAVYRCN